MQDNWKITSKLTVDAGMRFTHHGPQYDIKQQASNFFPDQWSASKAPLLYQPGCSTGAGACAAANRIAVNPVTGASLGAGSALAIGTIVPNTGVADQRDYSGGPRHCEGKLHRAADGVRAARRRRLRSDRHAADGGARQRRRVLRSAAGRFDLRPDRQSADRSGIDRRQLDAAVDRGRDRGAASSASPAGLLLRCEDRRVGELERRHADDPCRGRPRWMCRMWPATTTTRFRSAPFRYRPARCRWT